MKENKKEIKKYFNIVSLPVIFASMCCLSPLLLVIFGLSTISFAASLSDLFYGTYKWTFRSFGLILLIISLFIYFRSRGVCTLDKVKRNRNQIINTVLISLIIFIVGYIIFLYVIVHYIGVFYGIWS